MNKKALIILTFIPFCVVSCNSSSSLKDNEFLNIDARRKLNLDLDLIKSKESSLLSDYNSIMNYKIKSNDLNKEFYYTSKGIIYSNDVSLIDIEEKNNNNYNYYKYKNALINDRYYRYVNELGNESLTKEERSKNNINYPKTLDLNYNFLLINERSPLGLIESILLLNPLKVFKDIPFYNMNFNEDVYLINENDYSLYKINKENKVKIDNISYLLKLDINSNLYFNNNLLSKFNIDYSYSLINEKDNLDLNNLEFNFYIEGNLEYSKTEASEEILNLFQ